MELSSRVDDWAAYARGYPVFVWGKIERPTGSPIRFTDDPAEDFKFCVVGKTRSVEQLYEMLVQQRKLLYPILNFSGQPLPRCEFSSAHFTELDLRRGIQQTAHLVPEVDHVSSEHPDFAHFAALALAARYDDRLSATWSADSQIMVSYPTLAGLENPRELLEELAELDLLGRTHFDRIHVCPKCNSSRVNVREECNKCQSSDLAEVSLIYHYKCAFQGPEPHFLRGDELQCPKCSRKLRHYGLDYDRPNEIFACNQCGEEANEPDVGFVCCDCHDHFAAERMSTRDWYHYSSTPTGQNALVNLQLPKLSLAGVVDLRSGGLTPSEFRRLVDFTLQVAQRYERPWSAGQIRLTNLETLSEALGMRQMSRVLGLATEIIGQQVRSGDAITAKGDAIYLLLPETSVDSCQALIERIQAAIVRSVGAEVDLEFESFSVDQAEAFLSRIKQ